jgi:hypothetical protein
MDPLADRDTMKRLYQPPAEQFTRVNVPELTYFMVDGAGSPQGPAYARALKYLSTVVFPIRVEARKRMGADFVEPPVEALYWSDDPADFVHANLDKWKWRIMIVAPPWITEQMLASAVSQAETRLGPPPETLQLEKLEEGDCVQILHRGDYPEQGPIMHRLHGEYLPAHGLAPAGYHHEIYLNDPNRTAPDKRRTILRQPVKSVD